MQEYKYSTNTTNNVVDNIYPIRRTLSPYCVISVSSAVSYTPISMWAKMTSSFAYYTLPLFWLLKTFFLKTVRQNKRRFCQNNVEAILLIFFIHAGEVNFNADTHKLIEKASEGNHST